MNKQQVLHIGGGESLENYSSYLEYIKSVKISLDEEKKIKWHKKYEVILGASYQIIRHEAFDKDYSDYEVWKIMFEKLFQFLDNNIILVGHSLGGTFLVKYLNENILPISIKKIFLIAPAFADSDTEVLGNFNFDKNLVNLRKYKNLIKIYYSYDDSIVPNTDFENYKNILDKAEFKTFEDRFHFIGEEFPEIFEDIKNLY